MPDIAGKLFPNLTTLIVQLLSTEFCYLFLRSFYGKMSWNILLKEQIT